MRFYLSLGAFVFSACACQVLLAEEPVLPKPEKPLSSATVSPAPQLIPADLLPANERAAPSVAPAPALPTIPQLDEAFKQEPISPAAENARRHAEWRRLQNRVVNQLDLKAALRNAERAPTDLQKRKLLRRYYEMYFERMISLASTPEMKAYLQERKTQQLNTLPQPRVRPESTSP